MDDRNLIFGHKLHIGMPYCGYRFWTRQIPTSCLSLLTEADHNFVIPKRKQYYRYTFKKGENIKWPLITGIFGKFLGMYEPLFT